MNITMVKLSFVALFAIAATLIHAAEPSPIPKRLSAYVGGFMGASYSVELRDGALVYTMSGLGHSSPKHKTVIPTAAQWRGFRQTLDEMNLWRWRKEYPNHSVADGTQWSLDIAYADHALHSHGDNNYPDDTGKPNRDPEPTKAFTRYLAAVEKLLGGAKFR
jgi:hypothetical protein